MQAVHRKNTSSMAPTTKLPSGVQSQGAFSLQNVRKHMLIDMRWTPTAVSTQFNAMADLLTRKRVLEIYMDKAKQRELNREGQKLDSHISEGYKKLRNIMHGGTQQDIRNVLINNKELLRLYSRLPIELTAVNMEQRTFILSKERDRLIFRLKQLKSEYNEKLLISAKLQTHIKYGTELDEELKAHQISKDIENSRTRLNAVKTITATYRAMRQVLYQDAVFYEPIIKSLAKDIKDQDNFIRHVLYLGSPAIRRFRELSEEHRMKEDKSRHNLRKMAIEMTSFRTKRKTPKSLKERNSDTAKSLLNKRNNFARETTSMLFLKRQLELLENTIKSVKDATLCSRSADIYPRIKKQQSATDMVEKRFLLDTLKQTALNARENHALLLVGMKVNNLDQQWRERLNRIEELRQAIGHEDEKERTALQMMKNRSDIFVIFRYWLWNVNEIMRYVDKPPKLTRSTYKNSYMKLPLLKFDEYTMRAYAPEQYERNVEKLVYTVKRKLLKLVKVFNNRKRSAKHQCTIQYMNLVHKLQENFDEDVVPEMRRNTIVDVSDSDDDSEMFQFKDAKITIIPNRRYIKLQSAKIVEEAQRRDE